VLVRALREGINILSLQPPHVPPSSPCVGKKGGRVKGGGRQACSCSTGAETVATRFHGLEELHALLANVSRTILEMPLVEPQQKPRF